MNKNTYKIILSGLFIALSVVLTRVFSTDLPIGGVPAMRLAVGFLPIILASIIVGPYYGMIVGGAADVIGYLLFPKGMYFPLITLTSVVVGLLPYFIYRWSSRLKEWLRVLLAVAGTHVVCSLFMQTLWLSILFGTAYEVLFYPRIIATLIAIPVYFVLVLTILKGLKKASIIDKMGYNNR